LAVERSGELKRHERPGRGPARPPRRHGLARCVRQDACFGSYSGGAQPGDAAPVGARIRVLYGDNNALNRGLDEQIGAARSARAEVRAGLKRDVCGGPARILSRGLNRHGFGVRTPPRLCPAATDDAPVSHEDAPDIGIGRRACAPTPGERDSGCHPFGVGGRTLHRGYWAGDEAGWGPRAARSASVERFGGVGLLALVSSSASSPSVSRVSLSASAESYSTPIMSASF